MLLSSLTCFSLQYKRPPVAPHQLLLRRYSKLSAVVRIECVVWVMVDCLTKRFADHSLSSVRLKVQPPTKEQTEVTSQNIARCTTTSLGSLLAVEPSSPLNRLFASCSGSVPIEDTVRFIVQTKKLKHVPHVKPQKEAFYE